MNSQGGVGVRQLERSVGHGQALRADEAEVAKRLIKKPSTTGRFTTKTPLSLDLLRAVDSGETPEQLTIRRRRERLALPHKGNVRVIKGLVGNRWLQAATAVGGGTAAAGTALHHTGKHRLRDDAIAAGGGAYAGALAHQAPAYLDQNLLRPRRTPPYMRRDVKQSDLPADQKPLKRQYEAERRQWLAAARNPDGTPNRAKQYRTYPQHWPGSKAERIQGWTHAGRTGNALGGALILSGAALAARHADHQHVGKAHLELEDKRFSPYRAAGVGVGSAFLVGGLANARAVGGVVRYNAANSPRHATTLQRLERGRAAIAEPTAAAGRLIHRSRGVGGLVQLIPAKLRPYAAAGLGMSVIERSTPVRVQVQRPVVLPPTWGS